MGKTSYQNITDLIDQLNNKLKELNEGNLEIGQVESMVENSKELYERLVVLRYKVYEKYGDPTEADIKKVEEETPFDFTDLSEPEQQIEEPITVAEKKEIPAEPIQEEKESIDISHDIQPGFDFTAEPEEEKALSLHEKIESTEESLHDKLKIDEDELSLRKQLQNTPIKDIKSEITIARRFEYISILFNGDSDAYDKAIEDLNSCSDASQARIKLNEYSTTYEWDLENKAIIKFVELVERRYL